MTVSSAQPATSAHPWSPEALFAKAQRYTQEMGSQPRDDWRFALYSAFVLEFLARAAVARVSPALLADTAPRDANNLLLALGVPPKASKFTPRSIDTNQVFVRLREILPDFDPELEAFSLAHLSRRNEELHSGTTPLDGLRNSTWLPAFYRACDALLKQFGQSLESFLGEDEAAIARAMIEAAADASAKQVAQTVSAHRLVWDKKNARERERLSAKASVWAARHEGHRAVCPACGSEALISGTPISPPKRTLDDDTVTETQEYLPYQFECIACGLKIAGLAQLRECGLGDAFKSTQIFSAIDFFIEEYTSYEEDFNE